MPGWDVDEAKTGNHQEQEFIDSKTYWRISKDKAEALIALWSSSNQSS